MSFQKLLLIEKVSDWSMILHWEPFDQKELGRCLLINNFLTDSVGEIFVDISILHSGLFVLYLDVCHLFSHVIVLFLVEESNFRSRSFLSLSYAVFCQFDHSGRARQVLKFYVLLCRIPTTILIPSSLLKAGSLWSRPYKIIMIIHLVGNKYPSIKIIPHSMNFSKKLVVSSILCPFLIS